MDDCGRRRSALYVWIVFLLSKEISAVNFNREVDRSEMQAHGMSFVVREFISEFQKTSDGPLTGRPVGSPVPKSSHSNLRDQLNFKQGNEQGLDSSEKSQEVINVNASKTEGILMLYKNNVSVGGKGHSSDANVSVSDLREEGEGLEQLPVSDASASGAESSSSVGVNTNGHTASGSTVAGLTYVRQMWWVRLVLIVIGIACNGFGLLVLMHKTLRSISVNVLIAGLTIGNLLLLCTLLATTRWAGAARPPAFSCRALMFALRVGISWTTLMMSAVSVDRFIAVCLPLYRLTLCRRKWAVLVTMLLLLLSIGDGTVQMLIAKDQSRGMGLGVIPGCLPLMYMLELQSVYYMLHCVLIYIVPWLIVCSLNTCIINSLRLNKNRWKENSTAKCVGEFRLNVSLVVICISYALLCLPDVVFMILSSRMRLTVMPSTASSAGGIGISPGHQEALRELGYYGYVLLSIIGPVALLSVGTKYRKVIAGLCGRDTNAAVLLEFSRSSSKATSPHGRSTIVFKYAHTHNDL